MLIDDLVPEAETVDLADAAERAAGIGDGEVFDRLMALRAHGGRETEVRIVLQRAERIAAQQVAGAADADRGDGIAAAAALNDALAQIPRIGRLPLGNAGVRIGIDEGMIVVAVGRRRLRLAAGRIDKYGHPLPDRRVGAVTKHDAVAPRKP